MKTNSLINLTAAVVALLLATGCKKSYLDTKPSDAITPDQAYESIAAVNSAIDASYLSSFQYGGGNGAGRHDNFGQKAIDLANDLMGNDMTIHTQGYGWFNADYQYTGWTLPNGVNTRSDQTWSFYYMIIKQANLILDNTANQTQTNDLKAVRGEALALRAWAHFNLVNNFQQTYKGNTTAKGIPVYTSIGPAKGRGTVEEVYEQVKEDLTDAETLLNGQTRSSKKRIDVSVVRGIRARVALVMEDWTTAESYAKSARTGYTLMSAATLVTASAFSNINNSEWMWGAPITAAQATIYASFFSHIDPTAGGYATLGGQKKITKALYDQINSADARKGWFMPPTSTNTTFVPYTQIKHRVPTAGSWAADYLYMRAAEMYLIEAEALARQTKDAEARVVLEALIKTRYPAYSAASFSGASLVSEILLQRRIELWGEGFSLFDIKRTGVGLNRPTGTGNHGSPNFNPIVYTQVAASPLFLMRIPTRELDNNPNMTPADQNP